MLSDVEQQKKGRRRCRCCCNWFLNLHRWQKIAFVLSLCIVLIGSVLCVVYFVFLNAIIRSLANDMKFEVESISLGPILGATFENGIYSIPMAMNASMYYSTFIDIALEESTVHLCKNEQECFASFQLHSLFLEGEETSIAVVQNTTAFIYNLDLFNVFALDALENPHVNVVMTSTITGHASLFHFNVDVVHDIRLGSSAQSENSDMYVNSVDVMTCSETVTQLDVNATFINPSPLEILTFGKFNMSVYFEETWIGYALSKELDLSLLQGKNIIVSELYIVKNGENNDAVTTFFISAFISPTTTNMRLHGASNALYVTNAKLLEGILSKFEMEFTLKDTPIGLTCTPHIIEGFPGLFG